MYCLCANVYCTVLHCTVLHCTVLYCTVLYCTGTALHCTVLLFVFSISIALFYVIFVCKCVLYCTVLHCTVLLFVFSISITLFYVIFVCKCVLYCTTATGCQPNCSSQYTTHHNTAYNWTQSVNSQLSAICKRRCWHKLSNFTVLNCTPATGCQPNCSSQYITYRNTANNWTHSVSSQLSAICKRQCWHKLSNFTLLYCTVLHCTVL